MDYAEHLYTMLGLGPGVERITIPSNLEDQYNYVTFINTTDNMLIMYPLDITQETPGREILTIMPYSSITYPLVGIVRMGFNIVWKNINSSLEDIAKVYNIIFSEDNLAYNQSYAVNPVTTGTQEIFYCKNLKIRDTANHFVPGNGSMLNIVRDNVLALVPNATQRIMFITNTLDKDITWTLWGAPINLWPEDPYLDSVFMCDTGIITAGNGVALVNQALTTGDIVGARSLSFTFPRLFLNLKAATAPTAGDITALLSIKKG